LGAGKTTFTQAFIGEKEVLSPTYSILSESKNCLHADLYRIEKNEDILSQWRVTYCILRISTTFSLEWGMKFVSAPDAGVAGEFHAIICLRLPFNEGLTDSSETPSRNFLLSSLHED
jgi:hypothetical protein